MSLTEQLNAISDQFQQSAPEPVKQVILTTRQEHVDTFDYASTIQVGQKLPKFQLSDATGKKVDSDSLLAKGPLLMVFYRGQWCPFCNLYLGHLQKHYQEFEKKGVSLVAISPELPDTSLSTVEKNELKFPVLTDLYNAYAEKLGIVNHQSEAIRPIFEKFGNNLKERNGQDSLDVPVPTTLLVDAQGVVRNTYIEADYTKRLEPSVALEWISKL